MTKNLELGQFGRNVSVSDSTGYVSFGSTVTFGDDDRIIMGDSSDLKIYHDGSNSYVTESGPGALRLVGDQVAIRNSAENMAVFNTNADVKLYYNNSKKFETTGTGVTVFGTTQTQQLNVSGVSTFSGNVSFAGTIYPDGIGIGTAVAETLIDVYGEGASTTQVSLRQWNDNSSGPTDGPDIRFFCAGGTIASPALPDNNDVIGKVNAHLYTGATDNDGYEQFGGFGWEKKVSSGQTGSNFAIQTRSLSQSSSGTKILVHQDGSVRLNHLTSKKFETTPTGAVVTGILTASSLDISGNVSIAGTLTYEDVTNVDSLGIATARSGLRVTAGGLVVTGVSTFNSDIDVTGHTETDTLNVSGLSTFRDDVKITYGSGIGLSITNEGDFSTADIVLNGHRNLGDGVVGEIRFFNRKNNEYSDIRSWGTGDIEFLHDGLSLLHMTGIGSVGIGTNDPHGVLHLSSGNSGDCELILESDIDNDNESDNPRIIFRQDGGVDQSAIFNQSSGNALVLANSTSTTGAGIRFKVGTTAGYTNAVEVARFTKEGRLGIGTEAPTAILEVATSVAGVATVARFKNTNGGGTDQTADIELGLEDTVSSSVILRAGKEANHNSGAAADNFFAIHTTLDNSSSEKLRITSDGKVGIGTNDPSPGYTAARLHVLGDTGQTIFTRYGHIITQNHNDPDRTKYWTLAPRSGEFFSIGYGVPTGNGTVSPDYLTISGVGSVAIGGTDAPRGVFQVKAGDHDRAIIVDDAVGGVGLARSDYNGESLGVMNKNKSPVAIYVQNDDGSTLDDNITGTSAYQAITGELLIDGTKPGTAKAVGQTWGIKFHAGDGTGNVSDRSAAAIHAIRESASNVNTSLAFKTRSTTGSALREHVRIVANGQVGIGTTVPKSKVDVFGEVTSTLPFTDMILLRETWSGGINTTTGHDLGTWVASGTGFTFDTTANNASPYTQVDDTQLTDNHNYIIFHGDAGDDPEFISPTIDLSTYHVNDHLTSISNLDGSTVGSSNNSTADSRYYMMVLCAAQSMDATNERLEIRCSRDDGSTYELMALVFEDNDPNSGGADGTADTTWRKVVIDISRFVGSSTFKIKFTGTSTGTADSYGISNIYIYQAPIPNKFEAKDLRIDGGNIYLNEVATGGYLGIGTDPTLSSEKLTVAGDISLKREASTLSSLTRILKIEGARSNASHFAKIKFENYDTDNGSTTNSSTIEARTDGSDGGELRFQTKPSGGSLADRLTITGIGSVGIGIDDPLAALDVLFNTSGGNRHFFFDNGGLGARLQRRGDTSDWAMSYGFRSNDNTDLGGFGGHGTETGLTRYFIGNTYNDNLVSILSGGNVGIGTISPVATLDVNGGVQFTGVTTMTRNDTAGTTLHVKNTRDNGTKDTLLVETTHDRDVGVRIKNSIDYFSIWVDGASDDALNISDGDDTRILECRQDGGVLLCHNGTTKLETISIGATVSGSVTADSILLTNGYSDGLVATISTVTAQYGSVQVNGSGSSGWEGYSIDGRAVFMHNGTDTLGLYDDVNNHWAIRHTMGGDSSTQIRAGNNATILRAKSSGVDISGGLKVTDDAAVAFEGEALIHAESASNPIFYGHESDAAFEMIIDQNCHLGIGKTASLQGAAHIERNVLAEPALYVRNNPGAATTATVAYFAGDNAGLQISGSGTGADYYFGMDPSEQENGFHFFNGTGGLEIHYNGIKSVEFDSGNNYGDFKGTPTVNANTIWHAGNHGDGSGLDADKLDGTHLADLSPTKVTATALTNASNLNSVSDGFYKWTTGSNKPINAPFDYAILQQISDPNQKVQLAFGKNGHGRLAVRRADSGTFYAWTEFASLNGQVAQIFQKSVEFMDRVSIGDTAQLYSGMTYPAVDGDSTPNVAGHPNLVVGGGSSVAMIAFGDGQNADPVAIFCKEDEASDNQVVIIAGDGDGSEELLDIRSNANPDGTSNILSFEPLNSNSVFRVYGEGNVYVKKHVSQTIPVCHRKTDISAAVTEADSLSPPTVNFNLSEANSSAHFTVSNNVGIVTVREAGWYSIQANMVYNNGTSNLRNTVRAFVQKNGSEITSTASYDYNRGSSYGKSNLNVHTFLQLAANDRIGIGQYGENIDGASCTMQADECEFIIVKHG